jgi:glycosyltransferase involved in cell wall biosynthesis
MARVCHVQVFPLMSGAQRSMLESFKHLDRGRFELEVVCKEPGPLTDELARMRVPVHYAPHLDRPIRPVRDYLAYRELQRIFAARHYDIVHTHSSKPGVLGRLAACRAGVPVVIHHVHAFAFHEFSPPLKRVFYGSVERWASRYCQRLLFVNQEERALVIERGWARAEQCQTIYNGADLEEFHPTRRIHSRQTHRMHWQSPENEVVILFMGRLEYPKQPMLLVEIAQRLEALRLEVPWRLAIAGSGPEENALRVAISSERLEDRMSLLSWQDDPQGVLHAADIVLLVSLAEGLPRSLIEAQAAGLPIVASSAKGNREVVTDQSGFLCPPSDADAFARALARLIMQPNLRDQMGIAARAHAEACFDSLKNNRQIGEVYDSLLAA